MASRTVNLNARRETGLKYAAAEQGKTPDDFLQDVVASLADDWCRRMMATDRQAVLDAIQDDPQKLAAAKTALGL